MSLRPVAVAGLGAARRRRASPPASRPRTRSAELAAKGSTTLLNEQGPEIDQGEHRRQGDLARPCSPTRKAAAVVVDLHNDSDQNLIDVPILIDVLDAKGKSVYKNDIPGIEPALAAVPYIPADGDVDWVERPGAGDGQAKVGEGDGRRERPPPSPERCPRSRSPQPKLEGDPVSGIEATGTVVNKTGADQGRLLLYGVARKGNRIVAAGRGAIEHFKAGAKKLKYTSTSSAIPQGADVKVTEFPTLPGSQ